MSAEPVAPAPVTISRPLIYERIAAVMRDVHAVSKSRTNSFHKYQFRGIDDVLAAVAGALRDHEVFIAPNIQGDPKVVERVTTQGKAELHIVVHVLWKAYTVDGSFIECSTLGEASDTGDKGCNKAMSASQKYMLIQLLSIPTEGDNDTENRSPEFAAKGRRTVDDLAKPPRPAPQARQNVPALNPAPVSADLDGLRAKLLACKTADDLSAWASMNRSAPDATKKALARDYRERKTAIESADEPPHGALASDREDS